MNEKLRVAIEHAENGNDFHAIQLLEGILEEDGNDQDALNTLGVIAHKNGRTEDAISFLQRAVELGNKHPNLSKFHSNLGLIWMSLEDYEVAVKHFKSSILLNPEDPESFNDLGTISFRMGNYQEALHYCYRALDIAPDFSKAAFNIAHISRTCGDFGVAPTRVHCQKITNLNIPPIIINTLPKSATAFITNQIQKILNIPMKQITSNLYFPSELIVGSFIHEFANCGKAVAGEHFPANTHNLALLSENNIQRIVVNMRDPRQAMLSWIHFMIKLNKQGTITYDSCAQAFFEKRESWRIFLSIQPPVDFFSFSFFDQVNWGIREFLPVVVKWIKDWIKQKETNQFSIDIKFTRYEDFLTDNKVFIREILEFYNIKIPDFDLDSESERLHFRTGKANEWSQVLTEEQIVLANSTISEEILSYFNWCSGLDVKKDVAKE